MFIVSITCTMSFQKKSKIIWNFGIAVLSFFLRGLSDPRDSIPDNPLKDEWIMIPNCYEQILASMSLEIHKSLLYKGNRLPSKWMRVLRATTCEYTVLYIYIYIYIYIELSIIFIYDQGPDNDVA